MNRIDKKILEILQSDSQMSNNELAEKVALSPSPCSRRVKQLEEEGYIKKYVALLDSEKIGLQLTIMALVGLNSHDSKIMKGFEKAVESLFEVVQCYMIAGRSADYLLKIVVPDMDQYQSFLLEKLTRIDGVSNVQSNFVLRNIINNTTLPLNHL